jgi:hypothetical protein
MIASDILETPATTPSGVASGRRLAGTPDDKDMLRAAVDLTRDIARRGPDLLARHAGFGGAGLCRAGGRDPAGQPWAALACGVLAALALYRALLFIHELTHIHKMRCRASAGVEPAGRHPDADALVHVRRRPHPAPRRTRYGTAKTRNTCRWR